MIQSGGNVTGTSSFASSGLVTLLPSPRPSPRPFKQLTTSSILRGVDQLGLVLLPWTSPGRPRHRVWLNIKWIPVIHRLIDGPGPGRSSPVPPLVAFRPSVGCVDSFDMPQSAKAHFIGECSSSSFFLPDAQTNLT